MINVTLPGKHYQGGKLVVQECTAPGVREVRISGYDLKRGRPGHLTDLVCLDRAQVAALIKALQKAFA